jgi:hypothetical protein
MSTIHSETKGAAPANSFKTSTKKSFKGLERTYPHYFEGYRYARENAIDGAAAMANVA